MTPTKRRLVAQMLGLLILSCMALYTLSLLLESNTLVLSALLVMYLNYSIITDLHQQYEEWSHYLEDFVIRHEKIFSKATRVMRLRPVNRSDRPDGGQEQPGQSDNDKGPDSPYAGG